MEQEQTTKKKKVIHSNRNPYSILTNYSNRNKKWTDEILDAILEEVVEWFLAKPENIFVESFFMDRMRKAKKKNVEWDHFGYQQWRIFRENPKYKDIIKFISELQESKLKNGVVLFNDKVISTGCKFMLQAKYGYVPKEEVRQITSNIELKFNDNIIDSSTEENNE